MRTFRRWLPALVWMAVIFILSHQPGRTLESYMPLLQTFLPWMKSLNGGHVIAYFILALAVYYGLGSRFARARGRLLTIAICALYGVSDEYHQTFVDGRTAEWIDLINDTLGASLAMLLMSIPRLHRWYQTFITKP